MGLQSINAPADAGCMGERGDMLKRLQKWPTVGTVLTVAVVSGLATFAVASSINGQDDAVVFETVGGDAAPSPAPTETTTTAAPDAVQEPEPAPVEQAPAPVQQPAAQAVEVPAAPVEPVPAAEPAPAAPGAPPVAEDRPMAEAPGPVTDPYGVPLPPSAP